MKIIIQPFSNENAQEIAQFICDIQREEFGIAIGIAEQPDLLQIPQVYQQLGGNFWLAVTEAGQLIGTIALAKFNDQQGALKKMFVASEFRKAKVGAALLEALLQFAQREHFSEIYLGTNEVFQAAQHFYQRNNFIEIKKNELPADFPALAVDNRFYKRQVMKA